MTTLNRNNSNWSAEERRKINENWQTLESFTNNSLNNTSGLRERVEANETLALQANSRSLNALNGVNAAVLTSGQANQSAVAALSASIQANTIANQSRERVDNLEVQLNEIVAESGSNNPEVVASRIDLNTGENFVSLPERLNTQHREFVDYSNRTYSTKHPIILDLLNTPNIIAHRGLSNVYPENTLPAFYECYKRGIKYFEVDFRKTVDGNWVCHHDETTERATGVNLTISQTPLNDLRLLRNSRLKNSNLYGNPLIPTIEEVFQFIKDTKTIFIINFDYGILTEDIPTIINLIYKYGIQNNVVCPGARWHDFDPKLCISNGGGIGTSEQEFINAGRNGNIMAAYNYGYSANLPAINVVTELSAKYNVPIVIYVVESYTAFRATDPTTVHGIQVDNLWFRGAF